MKGWPRSFGAGYRIEIAATRRIRLWRDVGSGELSSLLDQLETEFQADSAPETDTASSIHAR